MIERFDAASLRWPFPLRLLYLAVKWYLVCTGAFVLVGAWVMKMGPWFTALAILGPLLYGFLSGWQKSRGTDG